MGKDTATEIGSNSSADIALDSITQTILKNDIKESVHDITDSTSELLDENTIDAVTETITENVAESATESVLGKIVEGFLDALGNN